MKHPMRMLALIPLLIVSMSAAHAASYADAITVFKKAGASATFFGKSYAYAVFPTVGSGALGVGGAFGRGRVFVHDMYTGDATLAQVSVGFQAGGKAYSDRRPMARTPG
jgi:hypothetical protein